MTTKRNADVLIVGAGPVGLLTALELAQAGVAVQIIDQEWRTAAHSYALALHPASLDLLDRCGVGEEVLRRGRRIERVVFAGDGEPQAELRYGGLAARHPFVVVLRQDVLESLLVQRLHALGVEVGWLQRAAALLPDDDRVTVTVERLGRASAGYAVADATLAVEQVLEISAKLVIGADGHRSFVRRALDIDFAVAGEPTAFAVFEFTTPGPAADELRVLIDERTTSALWPMPEGHVRWSFELENPDDPLEERFKSRWAMQVASRSYPLLPEEQLRELLRARAPWFTGSVRELHWSMLVRFERRLAERAGSGRAWRGGDALHTTGPVGVQSMNIGLREGRALAAAVVSVLRHKAELGLLAEYGHTVREEWRQMLGQSGGPTPALSATPWVRQQAGRLLPCVPASGAQLAALLAQIGLELRPVGA